MIRKALIYVWAALACVSLVVYAFTGHVAWEHLDPQTDGGVRLILLFAIHIGWVPAIANLKGAA